MGIELKKITISLNLTFLEFKIFYNRKYIMCVCAFILKKK